MKGNSENANLSFQYEKFRNFRNKRYQKPKAKCFSLDCEAKTKDQYIDPNDQTYIIPDLKKIPKEPKGQKFTINKKESSQIKVNDDIEASMKESYYQIKPKKISTKPENPILKSKIAKKNMNNNQEIAVNESKFSIDRINHSKVSTQDQSFINRSNDVSFINRSNAIFYSHPRWKRSNSDAIKNKKTDIITDKNSKILEIQKGIYEKAANNMNNELLLKKITTVFRNFKEKQEEILKNFNNGRRSRLKGMGMVKCPKIAQL